MGEKIRLQKYMSEQGICSRRKAEEYISAGKVFINGKPATIGVSVDPKFDKIEFGDELIQDTKNHVYYKIYKPRGIETTCAQKGGQSIIDIISVPERVFPIGRLDKESTGLIIMTNDGRITQYLTHPRYEHEKEYVVETFGPIHDRDLDTMSKGVMVLGKTTKSCHIERMSAGKFRIILTEGRNRQIRRMVESVGGKVKKLKRVRVENILLGNMSPGEYKKLNTKEKDTLFKNIGLSLGK